MKIKNPLNKFTSHSIHYILLAAGTSTDLNGFNTEEGIGESGLKAIDEASYLGDIVSLNGSQAHLMIDTRRFSQFTVTAVKSNVIPALMSNAKISPMSHTNKLSFDVIDPMGVLFQNFLQLIMQERLKVSMEGMMCLFKILFVGHLADGTTETVHTVSIPCIFHSVTLEMHEMRGLYHCTMTPMIGFNGVANVERWLSIGTASKFFTGPNKNTLGSIVDSFERALNEQSANVYDKVNQNNTSGQKFGRKVEYMITIPEKWKNFQMSGPNQNRIEETSFVELMKKTEQSKTPNKNPAKDSNIAVPPSSSITQALDIIFSQCVELIELGVFKQEKAKTEKLVMYRHITNVTSDNDSFMVHVDVVEFVIPNTNLASKNNGGDPEYFYTAILDGKPRTYPKNAIEYDYIFSGTNIDVLDLALKFENLNFMLLSPDKVGVSEMNNKKDTEGFKQTDQKGTVDTNPSFANNISPRDPVFFNERTWADQKNYNNVASNVSHAGDPKKLHQQYIKNLAAHYSTGGAPEAVMSVRGNPYLISAVTVSESLPHVRYSSSNKDAYRKVFEEKLTKVNGLKDMERGSVNLGQFTGGNLLTTPMYVKVNIYGPKFDVNKKGMFTHEVDPEADYSELYFNENFYYCAEIETEISDGAMFKHTFKLKPFSVFGLEFAKTGKK